MNNDQTPPSDDHGFPKPSDLSVDLQRRLDYLSLSEEDAARLRKLLPSFSATSQEFVDKFYRHLLQFEETNRFLTDAKLIERLKESQNQHLESLLSAHWDEFYLEQRKLVGQTHADVGIEPQWFLGAYNQYIQHHIAQLMADKESQESESLRAVGSLVKAVLLDVGLTLDVYFSRSTLGLRRALDMYWKANIELRQFAQLTSHDLKTPLATAANLCDEALDEFGDQMPEGARELVDAARTRMYRMGTTIDELLRSVLAREGESLDGRASMEDALRQATERVRPMLLEKSIVMEIPKKLPEVAGDQVRLREVFYNLLTNAAKFMDKEEGRIVVLAEVIGDRCLVTFEDNGPGIPVGEHEKIFAPFRRLAQHQDIEGSGVGLYFAKSLVEQQGGRIWSEPREGGGSRFVVELNMPLEE